MHLTFEQIVKLILIFSACQLVVGAILMLLRSQLHFNWIMSDAEDEEGYR